VTSPVAAEPRLCAYTYTNSEALCIDDASVSGLLSRLIVRVRGAVRSGLGARSATDFADEAALEFGERAELLERL